MFPPPTHRAFARPSIRRVLAAALVALVSWAGVAPAYAQKSCLPAKTTTVRANQRWVDSGRTLSGGEIVTITAKGTWTTGPMPSPLLGPAGLPFECGFGDCADLDLNFASIVARVGDLPPFAASGMSFHNRHLVPPAPSTLTGALAFQINDRWNPRNEFMADNTGQMKVTTASLTISCPGGTWSDCMSSVKVSPK